MSNPAAYKGFAGAVALGLAFAIGFGDPALEEYDADNNYVYPVEPLTDPEDPHVIKLEDSEDFNI